MKKISLFAFFLIIITQTNQESFIVKKPKVKKESRSTQLENCAHELLEINDAVASFNTVSGHLLKETTLDARSLIYEDKKSFLFQANSSLVAEYNAELAKIKNELYQAQEKIQKSLNKLHSLKSPKKC